MEELETKSEFDFSGSGVVIPNELDANGACASTMFQTEPLVRAQHLQPLREQDRFLPIANISRIMKNAIPKSGKIAKDAKECVQECVSEFISFITSEASERCAQERRKTINGEDILCAMAQLGFDNYIEPLKLYLEKYRNSSKVEKVMQVNHVISIPVQSQTDTLTESTVVDSSFRQLDSNSFASNEERNTNQSYTSTSQPVVWAYTNY